MEPQGGGAVRSLPSPAWLTDRMDIWLKDYGAFTVSLLVGFVAALVTIRNLRREHDRRKDDWIRDLRFKTYSAFMTAAGIHFEEQFWKHSEYDPMIMTEPPNNLDPEGALRAYGVQMGQVHMLGPAAVVEAAVMVDYEIRYFVSSFNDDPYGSDQSLFKDALRQFVARAQEAAGIAPFDNDIPEYFEGRQTRIDEMHAERATKMVLYPAS